MGDFMALPPDDIFSFESDRNHIGVIDIRDPIILIDDDDVFMKMENEGASVLL